MSTAPICSRRSTGSIPRRRCSSSRRRRSRRSRRSRTRRSAREWLLAGIGGDEAGVARALRCGVDRTRREVDAFGIDPANMFEFWDWVGGRYSMWSAIGLSLMVAIGPDHFRALLAGAHEMDEHFRTAPFESQPAGARWRCSRTGTATRSTPRRMRSCRTRSHSRSCRRTLQQLEMESNGKSVRSDGTPVDGPTGAIVWGSAGTNGQHAYFQLLHQGTTLVPVDLVGFVHRAARARPRRAPPVCSSQTCFAQAEALAFGSRRGRRSPAASRRTARETGRPGVARRRAHAVLARCARRRVRAQGA